ASRRRVPPPSPTKQMGPFQPPALDAGVPFVAAVLPVTALALADSVEALDELDATHVLRGLVAQLALHAKTKRGAVGPGQGLIVHVVGEDGLLVAGVLEIQALVVFLPALPERVEAVDDDVARPRLDADGVQQRGQPHALPLGDGAPAFHAVVPGDLGPRG